jgi:hypothetical protein
MPQTADAVFYQLYFQTPEAEVALGRDLRQTFRSMFYSLSGNSPPAAGAAGLAAGMVPRNGNFLTNPVTLPSWLSEPDIDVYVEAFSRSGFRGALNWWRNIDRSRLLGWCSSAW